MPKAYSQTEREYIIMRLKEEGKACLLQYGVRKTSVDELVKRANIPKGTFYLFYASKELLFFDLFLEQHNIMQTNLLSTISNFGKHITQAEFSEILFSMYMEVDKSFLLRFITDGDLELVIRKLPPNIVAKHQAEDNFSVSDLFALIPQAQNKDIELYSSAFRGIFLLLLHKKEIGEAYFDQTLKLLINSLTTLLFQE